MAESSTPVPDPSILTTAQLLREIEILRGSIDDKVNARQREMVVAQELSDAKLRGEIQLTSQRFTATENVHIERFRGIEKQFSERDIRTDQAGTAASAALAAALQAAKELVGAQGEASAAAAVKSETAFTKQIDQITALIQTGNAASDARVTELKERIDRGEGTSQGIAANKSGMYALAGFLLTISLIINVLAANGVLGGGK